jgi:hypothetical protein
MMQAMGVPANGQVAIAVAQRGVLQNPGGATGNLGGAAAAVARRSRDGFRREIKRQIQGGQIQAAQGQAGQTQAGQAQVSQPQVGTPTNNQNPVAAALLLAPTFTPIAANAVLDQTNMRIAIPVRQVDGEFILTMQKMDLVQAIQPAQGEAQRPAAAGNGTTPATLEPAKPVRRQESNKDKYGQEKPAQNAIVMTMKMIDDMVNAVNWGGQAGITQMMSEYVKGQTGNNLPTVTV